jgi:hypothetical protein
MSGTILGRPINLYLGFVTAVINATVLLGIIVLTAEQIAGLNVLGAAAITLLAGSDRIQQANAAAATARAK